MRYFVGLLIMLMVSGPAAAQLRSALELQRDWNFSAARVDQLCSNSGPMGQLFGRPTPAGFKEPKTLPAEQAAGPYTAMFLSEGSAGVHTVNWTPRTNLTNWEKGRLSQVLWLAVNDANKSNSEKWVVARDAGPGQNFERLRKYLKVNRPPVNVGDTGDGGRLWVKQVKIPAGYTLLWLGIDASTRQIRCLRSDLFTYGKLDPEFAPRPSPYWPLGTTP